MPFSKWKQNPETVVHEGKNSSLRMKGLGFLHGCVSWETLRNNVIKPKKKHPTHKKKKKKKLTKKEDTERFFIFSLQLLFRIGHQK